MAVLTLLGTGMRLSELCSLTLQDIEDDGEASFLKIQRGKGAKFRRVPVSRRLRKELVRYLNRVRPDTESTQLLVRRDGKPIRVETITELFQRIRRQSGFGVHAHKFRHTFATEYLRQGGEGGDLGSPGSPWGKLGSVVSLPLARPARCAAQKPGRPR
jgi:integrase